LEFVKKTLAVLLLKVVNGFGSVTRPFHNGRGIKQRGKWLVSQNFNYNFLFFVATMPPLA
jgi:hypothetical protein